MPWAPRRLRQEERQRHRMGNLTVENNAPIFVVGMPRSGTTLVSSLLSAHSRITISPETHFLVLSQGFGDVDLSRRDGFERFWKAWSGSERFGHLGIDAHSLRKRIQADGAITAKRIFNECMEAYADDVGKPRWGEKTPYHFYYIGTLLEWYPDCTVILVIRDPRAVVASHRKTPWGSNTPICRIVREWMRSIEEYGKWERDPRVHLLRYEELVGDPEGVSQGICRRVHEQYEPRMLEDRSRCMGRVKGREGWQRDQLIRSQGAITEGSIERWKTELSPAQIRFIDSVTRRYRARFGYVDSGNSQLLDPLHYAGYYLCMAYRYLVRNTQKVFVK